MIDSVQHPCAPTLRSAGFTAEHGTRCGSSGDSSTSAASVTAPFTPDCSRHFVATYHYVRDRNTDGVTGLTPTEFMAQVRAIAARYRIVTADEFVACHEEVDGLALITFDDAVRDQWRAAQILDDLGFPGAFYAPMRPFSNVADRWCPQHLLHALAEHLGWAEFEKRSWPLLGGVNIDENESDRLYQYEVPSKRRLKYALAFAVTAARAAEVLHEVNRSVGLQPESWYLSADQLRDLQSAGHALGGHGFDHVPLSTLSDSEQAAELELAAVTMNKLCGARPRTIAYPFGRYSATTERLALGAGYTMGFSTANRIDAKYVHEQLAHRTG